MSSSRSVAAARARRSAPEPTQNYKSTGPVTSINSTASFTPGSSRLPPPQQQQQQQQQQDPTSGAKLTVTNAIALMSLRIGRLETFAYQYNLDKSNGELNGGHVNYDQTHSSVDDAFIQNIVSRLDTLEKEKRTQAQLQMQGQMQTQGQHIKQVDNSPLFQQHSVLLQQQSASLQQQSASLMKMSTDMKSLQDELKETKDLLLKLQSYTMDTNQKLVDIMFHDTNGNGFDIQQLEDCDETEFCDNDTSPVEILDDSESMSQTISGNLKDIINAELANQLQ